VAELLDVLANLEFPRVAYDVSQKLSIADLFADSDDRCGIYVWQAINGEIYAGQSVDVRRRYQQHRKNHGDIAVLHFKSVPPKNLAVEEKRIIRTLESAGFRLRNLSYTSVSYSPSIFDEVMSPEQQERWSSDPEFIDASGDRPEDPVLRAKYHSRYERFLKYPQADEFVNALRLYVRSTIPAFKRSEFYYWSCSCLPSGNQVIRLNIYLQEVFTIYFSKDPPIFQIRLAKSPLQGTWKRRIFKLSATFRYRTIFLNQFLASGGVDQMTLDIEGSENVLRMLEQPQIRLAASMFNLRLMRKGINLNYRSHCFDLADAILSE
jgi:hypothetical protein